MIPCAAKQRCDRQRKRAASIERRPALLAGIPAIQDHIRVARTIAALLAMPIELADSDSRRLAEDLAALTGETVDQAVRKALRERLDRERRRRRRSDVAEGLLAIGRRCAARPVRDPRPLDDLLDYDEDGLPR